VTARCVLSVVILLITTHRAETTYTTRPDQTDGMKLEVYLEAMCHKQTDDGGIVYITCIQTTCCGEIFLIHNVEIANVTLTTPT